MSSNGTSFVGISWRPEDATARTPTPRADASRPRQQAAVLATAEAARQRFNPWGTTPRTPAASIGPAPAPAPKPPTRDANTGRSPPKTPEPAPKTQNDALKRPPLADLPVNTASRPPPTPADKDDEGSLRRPPRAAAVQAMAEESRQRLNPWGSAKRKRALPSPVTPVPAAPDAADAVPSSRKAPNAALNTAPIPTPKTPGYVPTDEPRFALIAASSPRPAHADEKDESDDPSARRVARPQGKTRGSLATPNPLPVLSYDTDAAPSHPKRARTAGPKAAASKTIPKTQGAVASAEPSTASARAEAGTNVRRSRRSAATAASEKISLGSLPIGVQQDEDEDADYEADDAAEDEAEEDAAEEDGKARALVVEEGDDTPRAPTSQKTRKTGRTYSPTRNLTAPHHTLPVFSDPTSRPTQAGLDAARGYNSNRHRSRSSPAAPSQRYYM